MKGALIFVAVIFLICLAATLPAYAKANKPGDDFAAGLAFWLLLIVDIALSVILALGGILFALYGHV